MRREILSAAAAVLMATSLIAWQC